MEKITKAAPKFKTVFLGKTPPGNAKLKKLKYWCMAFHRYDLAPCYGSGSYGNLSFRVGKGSDEFIITASGLRLKRNLRNKDFFRVTLVDMKKKTVSGYGTRQPSSESMLHSAIYQKRKDVSAVFHGHSPELLKKSHASGIPQTRKEEPYGTMALVKGVIKILGKHRFIIMKNHGFISLGKSLDTAGKQAIAKIKPR